jgi:hypothetical protein
MSREKLMELLQALVDGEIDVDEVFDEIACHIDFEDHYEGE